MALGQIPAVILLVEFVAPSMTTTLPLVALRREAQSVT
jgi:hypothetical protein